MILFWIRDEFRSSSFRVISVRNYRHWLIKSKPIRRINSSRCLLEKEDLECDKRTLIQTVTKDRDYVKSKLSQPALKSVLHSAQTYAYFNLLANDLKILKEIDSKLVNLLDYTTSVMPAAIDKAEIEIRDYRAVWSLSAGIRRVCRRSKIISINNRCWLKKKASGLIKKR